MLFDQANGNTKWADAEKLEVEEMQTFPTFVSKGKGAPVPKGYQLIRPHVAHAVKHDGGPQGHGLWPTEILRRWQLKMCTQEWCLCDLSDSLLSIGELNGLELWAADISNAHLESFAQEKVCVCAGPEFGELQGHSLIVVRACHGLRTSGVRWRDRLAKVLKTMCASNLVRWILMSGCVKAEDHS